jgi:hypothetical protein
MDRSKLRRKRSQAFLRCRSEALFDDEAASLDPAESGQARLKRFEVDGVAARRQVADAIEPARRLRQSGLGFRGEAKGNTGDKRPPINH